jgi:hypothetical protein
MARPTGKGWKLLGVCGVDSGQLVVCDPCYIDSGWIKGQEPAYPVEVLTEKGKKFFPDNKDWSWQYNGHGTTYGSPQAALGGRSVNEARDEGLVKATPAPVKKEFSYRGCCDASTGDNRIPFEAGHEGQAVCFSSGYGDGCFEVWGKTNEDGSIVEVRIIME